MKKSSIQFISPRKSQQLTDLAEHARVSLSRYAGIAVDYNAVGLQTLDEWIDRHIRQFPNPSREIRTVWGAFLGETFRRRFEGQWGIDNSSRPIRLGVVCPKETEGLVFVGIMDQIARRIRAGMSESLAFYYTIEGVDIKS
ncbi:MAG: hypothetical protein ACP5JG_09170 [Anaerolineae bacterium]